MKLYKNYIYISHGCYPSFWLILGSGGTVLARRTLGDPRQVVNWRKLARITVLSLQENLRSLGSAAIMTDPELKQNLNLRYSTRCRGLINEMWNVAFNSCSEMRANTYGPSTTRFAGIDIWQYERWKATGL